MTDDDDIEPPPRPRKRRWKRVLRFGLIGFGLFGLFLLLARWQVGRVGERHLVAVTAGLDAQEPGWRLDELEKTRQSAAPPHEKNPAVIVLQIRDSFPPGWLEYRRLREWNWGPVTNQQPSFFEFLWLVHSRESTRDIRRSARERLLGPQILACPSGHYPLELKDNPYAILLPHLQKAREVLDLLDYDARMSMLEREPRGGVDAARAALVVGRSIGDEPRLISQLVRLAADRVAAQSAMQVLAWGEPKDGLADLQMELRAEADVPWLLNGLRGERAMIDRFFDSLREGKISLKDVEGMWGHSGSAPLHEAAFRAYKALLPGDQAKALEIVSLYIEAAKLPPHEQLAAIKAVLLPPRPPDDIRYLGTSLVIPACGKIVEAGLRTRADLLAGAVAVACERFRQKRGHWPATLEEIPKDILPEIPLDPFTGQTIQYVRLGDGAAVFTAGDDSESKSRIKNDPLGGLGRGWRLWDPNLRRVNKGGE